MAQHGAQPRRCSRPARTSAARRSDLTNTARTLRLRNGKPLVTDGPFIEAEEALGGFYARSSARRSTRHWPRAGRLPEARNGAVERATGARLRGARGRRSLTSGVDGAPPLRDDEPGRAHGGCQMRIVCARTPDRHRQIDRPCSGVRTERACDPTRTLRRASCAHGCASGRSTSRDAFRSVREGLRAALGELARVLAASPPAGSTSTGSGRPRAPTPASSGGAGGTCRS